MKIYGAGMAGLLAANMLRRYEPEVHELQPELPYNHGALLRFRTNKVAEATGQHFKKVRVLKSLLWNGNLVNYCTLQMSNAYSLKVTGRILQRSVIDLKTADRWVAPPDFIEKMTKGVNIIYDSPLKWPLPVGGESIISTIPMPTLMDIVGWDNKPRFPYHSIVTATIEIADPVIDVYQTIYAPGNEVEWYRASIMGHHLILEFKLSEFPNGFENLSDFDKVSYLEQDYNFALELFGLSDKATVGPTLIKVQRYGKLAPIDETIRRSFILGMTTKFHIYSVGRFATWRQILLDDIVNDVQVVDKFIQDHTEYVRHLGSV